MLHFCEYILHCTKFVFFFVFLLKIFYYLNIFRIAPGPPNVTDVGCGYYTMINLYIQCRSRDLYKL